MFIISTVADTVRVPPSNFLLPTSESVHLEIDKKYPNRIILDVGLVICRFGDAIDISEGICAAGDGGAHYHVVFKLIVFRPLLEEIIVGTIAESNEDGIRISLGNFFHDINLPAFWMLRPSHFDPKLGLWIWCPNFNEGEEQDALQQEEENRFEMPIGAPIRFRVKSINFTQVTSSAKGKQATTTSMSAAVNTTSSVKTDVPVRKRSTSVDLTDTQKIPACMNITVSICEDGLGIISWWTTGDTEENLMSMTDETRSEPMED